MKSVTHRIVIMLLPMILVFSGTAFSRIDSDRSDHEFETIPSPGSNDPDDPNIILEPKDTNPDSDRDIDIDFDFNLDDYDKHEKPNKPNKPINCVPGATCVDLDPDEAVFEEVLREMLDIPSNHRISTYHLWQIEEFVVNDDRASNISLKSLSRFESLTRFSLGEKGTRDYAEGLISEHKIHYGTTITRNNHQSFIHGTFVGDSFVPGLTAYRPGETNTIGFIPGLFSRGLRRFVPGIAIAKEFGADIQVDESKFVPGIFTTVPLKLGKIDSTPVTTDEQEQDVETNQKLVTLLDPSEYYVKLASHVERIYFYPGYYEASPDFPGLIDIEVGTFKPGLVNLNPGVFPERLVVDITRFMDLTSFGILYGGGNAFDSLNEFSAEFESIFHTTPVGFMEGTTAVGAGAGATYGIGAAAFTTTSASATSTVGSAAVWGGALGAAAGFLCVVGVAILYYTLADTGESFEDTTTPDNDEYATTEEESAPDEGEVIYVNEDGSMYTEEEESIIDACFECKCCYGDIANTSMSELSDNLQSMLLSLVEISNEMGSWRAVNPEGQPEEFITYMGYPQDTLITVEVKNSSNVTSSRDLEELEIVRLRQ